MRIIHPIIKSLLLIVSAITATVYAHEPIVKFVSPSTPIQIDKIMSAASAQGGKTAARAGAVASALTDTPFASTADSDTPDAPLRISLDSIDALDLVEYAIAAAKASMMPGQQINDFTKSLTEVRYRRGENNGFTSRLRYISDWIADNSYRNNIREITSDLPGNVFTSRTLDHITRNRDKYPALADSATFEKMQMLEMGYRVHKIPYMKRESIGKKQVIELLEDNDIIILFGNEKDSDMTDIGFIRIENGKPLFIHASRKDGKVLTEPESLPEYMKLMAKQVAGYRILRIKD